MRLPDEVLQCVVFLGLRDTTTGMVEYRGTAFLVSEPSGVRGAEFIYLVTALHVAEQVARKDFFIRINMIGGGSTDVSVDGKVFRWYDHPTDRGADVAVAKWAPPDGAEYRTWPVEMLLGTPERIEEKWIGVGDEAYVIGLFAFVPGKGRNLPILRTGTIAMMPSEPIPLSNWRAPEMQGYLVETMSIAGLSGSPVFAQRSIQVIPAEHTGRVPLAAGAHFLLGLIHGHWEVPDDAVDYAVDRVNQKGAPADKINAGVAIVVPAIKILETLRHPDIVEANDLAKAELEAQGVTVVKGGAISAGVVDGMEAKATRILATTSVVSTVVGRPFLKGCSD